MNVIQRKHFTCLNPYVNKTQSHELQLMFVDKTNENCFGLERHLYLYLIWNGVSDWIPTRIYVSTPIHQQIHLLTWMMNQLEISISTEKTIQSCVKQFVWLSQEEMLTESNI